MKRARQPSGPIASSSPAAAGSEALPTPPPTPGHQAAAAAPVAQLGAAAAARRPQVSAAPPQRNTKSGRLMATTGPRSAGKVLYRWSCACFGCGYKGRHPPGGGWRNIDAAYEWPVDAVVAGTQWPPPPDAVLCKSCFRADAAWHSIVSPALKLRKKLEPEAPGACTRSREAPLRSRLTHLPPFQYRLRLRPRLRLRLRPPPRSPPRLPPRPRRRRLLLLLRPRPPPSPPTTPPSTSRRPVAWPTLPRSEHSSARRLRPRPRPSRRRRRT